MRAATAAARTCAAVTARAGLPGAIRWGHLACLRRFPLCAAHSGVAATPATAPASLSPADGAAAASTPLYRDQNDTWVDRHAPASLRPYLKLMRVDRPIGTWLVLLPGWWGLAFAAAPGALPDAGLMAIFAAGAFLMRSAGCTVNDIWDRDYDRHVARTAQRPLAAGRLSLPAAVAFLAAQGVVGLGLLLQLNPATIALGCAAVPLTCAYPLMKRITYAPQLVLGLAMNYGVLMGWSAVHDTLDVTAALPLYAGGVAWTLVYDTLYAHQDAADDARLGLKSTALWFGDSSRVILPGLAIGAGAAWLAAGVVGGLAWPYYAAAAVASGALAVSAARADYSNRADLAARFVKTRWIGWILLAGIVAGRWLQPPAAATDKTAAVRDTEEAVTAPG